MKNIDKIKVFLYGRPMKSIYPYASRWQVFKYRVIKFTTRLLKYTVVTSMIAGAVYGSFKVGQVTVPSKTFAVVDQLPSKIAELKNGVLASLKKCESAGYEEQDAPIIFDANNKASIGVYQFQKKTVIHYYKTLYNDEITPKQAVLVALDEQDSDKLAGDIIFTTDKGLTNWINCTNKLGLTSQVALIKKLQK